MFNGFRKHDGKGFRDLLPGEYTQMAGRAGRRGKDKVGTVIIAAWTEIPSEVSVKTLLTGAATSLTSQFRLSYNMILNLLRVNDLSVEDMIKRSFSEFHAQKAIAVSDWMKKLSIYEKALGEVRRQMIMTEEMYAEEGDVEEEERIEDYQSAVSSCQKGLRQLLVELTRSVGSEVLPGALCPGRLVYVYTNSKLPCPCIAMVVREPATASSLRVSETSDGSALRGAGEMSAITAARAALTQKQPVENTRKEIKLKDYQVKMMLTQKYLMLM